jgi:hypothetical protein
MGEKPTDQFSDKEPAKSPTTNNLELALDLFYVPERNTSKSNPKNLW